MRGKCQQRALWAHFEGAFAWPQRFWRPLKGRWAQQPGRGERLFFSVFYPSKGGEGAAHKMVRWKVGAFVPIIATSFTSFTV